MTASYQRVKQLGFPWPWPSASTPTTRSCPTTPDPSGFEWEVGWNPIVVDEATWEPTTHQGISIWGHTPEGQTVIDKLTSSPSRPGR